MNFDIGGLKFSKLAVIEERVGEDVMCIVPFDVLNSEEVEAFRRALSETKGSPELKADVKVVTRSQARELAELDKCDEDAIVECLWSTVTPEGVEPPVCEEEQGPSSQPNPLNMPEAVSRVGEGHGADDVEAPTSPRRKATPYLRKWVIVGIMGQ